MANCEWKKNSISPFANPCSRLRCFLLRGGTTLEDAHDVGLLHDQELLTVDFDLGARPFAEQHPLTGLHVDGDELTGLVAATRANGDDLALRWLFLGGVRNDDTAGRLLIGLDALDDDAVMKRTKLLRILLNHCNFVCFDDPGPLADDQARPACGAS